MKGPVSTMDIRAANRNYCGLRPKYRQGEVPHRPTLYATLPHPLIRKQLKIIFIRRAFNLEEWPLGQVRMAIRFMKSPSQGEMFTLPDSSRV